MFSLSVIFPFVWNTRRGFIDQNNFFLQIYWLCIWCFRKCVSRWGDAKGFSLNYFWSMIFCYLKHATKSKWFDFACCRELNSLSKLCKLKSFLQWETLNNFHAICKKHDFVAVTRKNHPVPPKLKVRDDVNNFASYQFDVSNFKETILAYFNML